MVKHPVLYLLVLNIDVAKEICKDVIAVKELNIYNNKNWFYDDDSPLDFIFKVIVNQVVKTSTGLKYTKNSLDNRIISKIFLVNILLIFKMKKNSYWRKY